MELRTNSIEGLRVQIRQLQVALAQNNFETRREIKAERTSNLPRLLEARNQIYMSIAHRQGLIIEILTAELNFERKVAA